MRKTSKRSLSILLALVLTVGMLASIPFTATAMTAQQTVDWAWAQTQISTPYQCLPFVQKFTREWFGWSAYCPTRQGPYDIISGACALPNGNWQKLQGVTPQAGDIVLFIGGNYDNYYGHIGIAISSTRMIDANGGSDFNYGVGTRPAEHNIGNGYWGVVRPPYDNPTPAPARPTVTGTANIAVREIASLTWNRPANTTSFRVDIWHNGQPWKDYDTNNTATIEYFGTETGQWQFFVYAKGPGGISSNYQFNVNVAQSDYIPKKTIVYNNHVYSIYDIGTSWFVARDIAEQMGGHLVTINTVEERNKIIELLASGGKSWYWTDAIDDGTEGKWRWSTREAEQARDWQTSEPNNATSDVGWGTENFAAIYKANGKLNDLPNGTSEIAYGGFIVEVDDYSYVPSVTYNGHKYLRFDDVPDGGMTWKAAKSFAERMGGHLATITSAAELEAVKPLLAQGTKNGYLIGATDEAKEGTWTWVTGEAFSYKNWAPGEPNNHLGAQHFTQIYKSGTWDDVHDSTESVTCGILVEIEPTKTTTHQGNKYQLFEQQMTWKDAKAYCESLGGHLATITSSAENTAVLNLVKQGSLEGYHIGMTDEGSEGRWRWITGEALSYTDWNVAEKEPANTYGYQNFGLISRWNSKWHDIENYRQGFGFVCEFDNAVKYTVKFDSQGGSAAAAKSLSYNAAIGTLSTPTRTNYTFKGWYTAASGGTKITKDTKITKSVTFYAQWESVSATAIALNSTAAATLGVGQTTTRTATITPVNATDKTISWTSSNTAVATVSGGKVTAVAAGTATITAQTSNSKTASFKVTVKPAPTKIAYKTASATIGAGQTYATAVTLTPSNAQTTRTYSSSNTKIATVDSAGKVNGIAAGTATITVKTYNGKTASFKVTIKPAPTKIALSKAVTLGVGEKYQTSVTFTPTNAQTTRTYSSSNTKVATVDSTGKITAKAVGTAKITVKTYNGKTATITVTVKAAPSKVTLSRTKATLYKGESLTLAASLPSGTASLVKTWTSSNSKVATVSGGKITAKGKGSATVTVKLYNGKTASCKVTVK